MDHLVFVHYHVDGPEHITNLLYFGGVLRKRHVSLSDVVQLLPELQLKDCGTYGKNLLKIFPRLLRRFCILDVAEHLIRVHKT